MTADSEKQGPQSPNPQNPPDLTRANTVSARLVDRSLAPFRPFDSKPPRYTPLPTPRMPASLRPSMTVETDFSIGSVFKGSPNSTDEYADDEDDEEYVYNSVKPLLPRAAPQPHNEQQGLNFSVREHRKKKQAKRKRSEPYLGRQSSYGTLRTEESGDENPKLLNDINLRMGRYGRYQQRYSMPPLRRQSSRLNETVRIEDLLAKEQYHC